MLKVSGKLSYLLWVGAGWGEKADPFTVSHPVCLFVCLSVSVSPPAGVLAAKTTGTQTWNESSAEAGRAETWKEPESLFPPCV